MRAFNVQNKVEKLVAEGRYKEAAEAASASHAHSRAADLYERIWNFAAAAACAEEAGDLPRALSNALEAKDSSNAQRLASVLRAQGDEGKQHALEAFASRRHFASAAKLAEELGEHEVAMQHYLDGQLDVDAARLMVVFGRDRDAGKLLERAIETLNPGDERNQASLALGLLLARLMQHEEAIRRLQEARETKALRAQAERALIREFVALGLRDAAREVLVELRKSDASVARELDAFLRQNQLKAPKKRSARERKIVGGRYKLERLLGAGSSGRVYRANDEVSNKTVAVKLLAGAHAHGSEAYARFAREAKLATGLRHPNLIEVYDFSDSQGFLVMELMPGDSLEKKLREGMTPVSVRRMCLDVLSGLELAHQRGIIHRDLKPANIFFDARGIAKIGDFGVAHLLDLGQTQTGGLIGTLAYMAPEQITGAPLSIAADLYGIGVTLFEALTSRLPFQGPDFVAQHLGEEPPVPSEVSQCDPSWDDIILRLLAKNPGDRFDSIDALRRALHALHLRDESQPLLIPDVHNRTATVVKRTTGPLVAATAPESAEEAKTRYAFETPLGTTANSTLARAIDTTLNRSVIIERYSEALSEESERRLYALARGGGPFLQRALAYERGDGEENKPVAIFEAPAGSPIGERSEALSTRLATRLLKRLARAIAPLHASDRAHGSLHGASVLLDDRSHPTVLVCGLREPDEPPTAADDVQQIMRIISTSVGEPIEQGDDDARALVEALLETPGYETRETLLSMPRNDGEELHSLAEAIELVLLRQKQGSIP
ncbi:MAG: serine/threonine protein kinase [Myxococcales bacterium]|nr:serine/threonine protein kinase [Myxococcales bacterium]